MPRPITLFEFKPDIPSPKAGSADEWPNLDKKGSGCQARHQRPHPPFPSGIGIPSSPLTSCMEKLVRRLLTPGRRRSLCCIRAE